MKSNVMKSILILCAIVILSSDAVAQFSIRSIGGTSWLGVRAGANFSNESFSTLPDNSSTSMMTGIIGGITFEHWFDNSWAVCADVLYDVKGVDEQYANAAKNRQVGDVIYSGNDNFSMSYVEIPILLKYSLGRGVIRPYLCAGPSIGSLLQSSETASGSIAPVGNLKSYLQSTDLSVYGALGIQDEIYNGPILSFEAGYAVGLSNIYKSSPTRVTTNGNPFPDPIDPTGVKSGDIRLTVGAVWQF
jgi:hypothetical protein